MYDFDEHIEYPDVPYEFREVQCCLDSFVEINYQTAKGMLINTKPALTDITHYRGKVLDIIRNNPPLASVSRFFHDGREDYLWYSDFYDDITKNVYHKYREFVKPVNNITSSNYAEELAKIDLPYFKELVDLISLERLCMGFEEKEPTAETKEKKEVLQIKDEPVKVEQPITEDAKPKPTVKDGQQPKKRSYQPKLNKEQYTLLADCIETIRLFRRKTKMSELKKLLSGKLTEPLQVTNQKSLVYLFDQLMNSGYIKDTWISVADGNKDFISFRTEGNKERYGDNTHHINMQQLLNCRNRNKRESIHGLEDIDDLIDQMRENLVE
ncbi:MAG: hypothetical protein E6767_14915 [Dysgonomonas sp.]|nr:hypothetical protein [Dysgonomonas sp.]